MNNKPIVKPAVHYVGNEHETLYMLEARRYEAIRKCAEEWAKIFNVSKEEYWQRQLPQALFDCLSSYADEMVKVVCEATLERIKQTEEQDMDNGQVNHQKLIEALQYAKELAWIEGNKKQKYQDDYKQVEQKIGELLMSDHGQCGLVTWKK